MAGGNGVTFPSQRTIAHLETGRTLLDNLQIAGAAHDTETMNSEARVDVRKVSCTVTDLTSATCSYEANRCTASENDVDGDGWCIRTSDFVRTDSRRSVGDIVVNGWGFNLDQ